MMPPRRKPTSTNQKKAEQQLKRAIKRGDLPPQEPKKNPHHRKPRVGPTGQPLRPSAASESSKRLQSAFVKLPAEFLEETRLQASTIPLLRPIPNHRAIFVDFQVPNLIEDALTCPRRPKWRFDMSKLEVERNEEGLFKKWLLQTDLIMGDRQNQLNSATTESATKAGMPASPSYFERNLEVWRQLWRVTEISQILLILLDSRCPNLHYPPSLANYLVDRKVILVLTKVDIAGPNRAEAWTEFLHEKYPKLPIVQVEAYITKEATSFHQGQKHVDPCVPGQFRGNLIEAIRKVHAEMLEPPERIKNNPSRLKSWVPPVKKEVNWDALLTAQGDNVGIAVGGPIIDIPSLQPSAEAASGDTAQSEPETFQEPEILTIGLIGQPNVGKSSLLNALFGARRVRASKTPGKTKHFQTLYWTADVRLVDCPGLVMPNFVPMEMQVLSGILPISRVSAIASCIYVAAQLLPLERIYNLSHLALNEPRTQDKRTWREGTKSDGEGKDFSPVWTAMDILTAYADSRGWVTAKAGRPDVNRAGNAILRAVAESRISWAFWPPGIQNVDEEGLGIWIPHEIIHSEREIEDERTERGNTTTDLEGCDDLSENESQGFDNERIRGNLGIGRFGALALSETSEVEESESSEEET